MQLHRARHLYELCFQCPDNTCTINTEDYIDGQLATSYYLYISTDFCIYLAIDTILLL